MLNFEPFSIKSLKRIIPYLKESKFLCSDYSAGALFMWQSGTNLCFCEWNDTLVIKQEWGEQPAYSWPIGKNPDGMIDELIKYVTKKHLPLRFFAINEETLEKIRQDNRLKSPMWAYDPRWSDYIYSFEEARTFSGKKYSGQRNHINRFKRLYGEPDIRFLNPDDYSSVLNMLCEYEKEHTDASPLELMELENTRNFLSVYKSLGLYAAGLFINGNIVAFSIGEIIGDMFLIHIEKALKKYEGVYPTMYSGFVRLMEKHPLKIINREDDSGDPGIRTSKMQYHPIKLIHKYLVHINSPAAKLDSIPDIKADNIILTAFRNTDKKAYLDLNTDVDNNRFWGYDYREDVGITEKISEDTFYNMAVLDMQVGDSVNLAVRSALDGEMIGEVILWNFTFSGEAELGCRIMPQYSGQGYGTNAFRATADFAEKVLGIKVYARCFHNNIPSKRMIAASGFELWYSNDTYNYYKRK